MKHVLSTLSLLTATVLVGCAVPTPATNDVLTGTQWELVAIESMDDAQGTTHVAQPERFTLLLAEDGRASLRLDCNRGTGRWTHTPAPGGSTRDASGTLQFEAIVTTRALCPPPALDQRVARDLGYVRSYRLKNNRLFMSLMADGGIYQWRPAAH